MGSTLATAWRSGARRRSAALVLALVLCVVLAPVSIAADVQLPAEAQRSVTVMTRNAYHGVDAEIGAVLTASGPADLLQKVADVYQGYHARDFGERAVAIVAEIEATQPALLGLQEAILVRTDTPPDGPATPATTVDLDYLEILLDALTSRGLHYEAVVESIGLDVELPSALGFDVRHTDREVILARADLLPSELSLSNATAGHFTTDCSLPSPTLGPVTIQRG